jgi:hypothetical protein
VGGRKPLLAMAPYWQPVIDCLKQEGQFNGMESGWLAPALDIVTLIWTPEEAAEHLRKNL